MSYHSSIKSVLYYQIFLYLFKDFCPRLLLPQQLKVSDTGPQREVNRTADY